ncbi:acyltransferase family protein [Roseobacter sp.]|uniref:acyltransferase family protein n=1 Tax=Roseobacter sp. TaxID=1907202 RepID=UPI00385F3BD8
MRSLAVIPVILFHAGASIFSGGFLGVDVFFVISGYLITGIILPDLERGEFSLLNFYERRARRILPALCVIVLTCVPMAWLFMLPDPLENFGQSVLATMLSLNNVLLTMTSGYWDLASEFKPLIHTWSLAVEEQFYVMFPLLLLFLHPLLKNRTIVAVWLVVIASFASSIVLVQSHPTSTFYLLHTRAWELGIGALGAFWNHKRKVVANEALSGIGLVLILASMLLFDRDTQHPSYFTLVPVLGTLLILLYAKEQTWVAKLLSIKILVGIGLISYSLYLWHQPIFSFARILSFEEPSTSLFIGLVPITFLLAYLTWRFVEQTFRRKSAVSTPNLVISSVATTAILCATGASFHLGQGFPARLFEGNHETAAGMHITYNHRISGFNAERFDPAAGTKVLIVGNSQARDFANIFLEVKVKKEAQLIYRSGFALCDYANLPASDVALVQQADIVFFPIVDLSAACQNLLTTGQAEADNIVFVGPKHFGYNLNAFTRLPREGRAQYTAKVFDNIIQQNNQNALDIPANHYIDLIRYSSKDGMHVRIFDADGNIISADRVHITQAGARFFADRIKSHPAFALFE